MNTLKLKFILFGLLGLTFFSTLAQEEKPSKEEKKEARKAKKAQKVADGKMLITPLIGPAYTPELGFLIAAAPLISFKTNKQDSLIQRSSLPVSFGVSSTGAVVFSSRLTSFWKQDKIRVYADFWVKLMPDHYWGVGYDEARYEYQSDSTTAYDRDWIWFYPRVLWQFKKNHFVGAKLDINSTKASNWGSAMAQDSTFQLYGPDNVNTGLGVTYQFDSRDIPVNAWKGAFVDVSIHRYTTVFGGDNKYWLGMLDLRKYYQLGKKEGSTLAGQLMTRLTTGEVPWGELSQLGTPFDLRGYIWGRYRDQSMLFGIAEYRKAFYKRNGKRSPHGAAVWVGTGSVGETVGDFKKWLPNYGVGYRLEVQPRMNLRMDFGWGLESFAFYFNFTEAF